jgi:hypothetical protein
MKKSILLCKLGVVALPINRRMGKQKFHPDYIQIAMGIGRPNFYNKRNGFIDLQVLKSVQEMVLLALEFTLRLF